MADFSKSGRGAALLKVRHITVVCVLKVIVFCCFTRVCVCVCVCVCEFQVLEQPTVRKPGVQQSGPAATKTDVPVSVV